MQRSETTLAVADSIFGWLSIADDDDELMLNVLRCHLTY